MANYDYKSYMVNKKGYEPVDWQEKEELTKIMNSYAANRKKLQSIEQENINRNRGIPSIPTKETFNKTYGYSQTPRTNAISYRPEEEKENKKEKLSYSEKVKLQQEIKEKQKKEKIDKIVNSNTSDGYVPRGSDKHLENLKAEGKKEADRLTEKVSKNKKNKLYTDVIEPAFVGGLLEPAADIGMLLTGNKEDKKIYKDSKQAYQDKLNGIGKFSKGAGSMAANIGMGNALGIDKLKMVKNPILNSALTNGIENVVMEGVTDLAVGDTDNFIKNRGKDFVGGAAMGGAISGIGEGIKKFNKGVKSSLDELDFNTNLDLDNNLTNINNQAKELRNKQLEEINKKAIPEVPKIPELPKINYDNRVLDSDNVKKVGNRKIGSLTDEMYELKKPLVDEAQRTLQELNDNIKGERFIKNGDVIGETEVIPTQKLSSPTIETIQGLTNASYDDIRKALNDIIEGKPLNATAKRIELILDDNLMNGSLTVDGLEIPPNEYYRETKQLYEELSKGNTNVLKEPIRSENKTQQNIPLNAEKPTESLLDTKKAYDEIASTSLEDKGLSRHKEVTAANSKYVNDDVKEFMSKYELDYDIKRDKDVIEKAMYESSKENAVNNFLYYNGKPTAEYVATGEVLFKKLQGNGDIEGAVEVLNKLSMEGTNLGQSMRMYRMMNSLTPEGKLMYTQRQIKKVADDILDSKPELKNKIDKEIKDITKEINTSNDDAIKKIVDEIENGDITNVSNGNGTGNKKGTNRTKEPKKPKEPLTPEQKLANKVDIKKKTNKKRFDDEKALINTLYEISRKSFPEVDNKKVATDPLKFVVEAIENKDKYHDVWNKAKEIIEEKYINEPDKLKIFDDWFNQKARPIFSEKKANQVISNALKEKNINIHELVRGYYNGSATSDLKEYIIKKSGFDGDNANMLGNYIEKRMHDLTKEKREQIISKLIEDKKIPTKSKRTFMDMLKEFESLGVIQNDNIRNIVLTKYNIPALTNKDAQYILETMKKVNESDGRQKEILLGQINKLISEKTPPTGMEKFDSYRYLNMLFNPKTMIKNVGGNVVNAGVGAGRDVIGSFIDNMVSKKTGIRTTGAGEKGYWGGIKKGFTETLEDHKLGIDTSHGAREGSKANALRDVPVLGQSEKLMRTGLQLGDRPFYEAAKNNFIENYKKLNNVTEVPTNVLEEAHKVGLEATYQQNTGLGDWANNLKKGKGGMLFKGIMPFTQTPAAILDTAINYTPIGAIKGANNINKAIKGVDVLANQRKGVNQLASGILGSGMIYGGYKAAENGLLTGDLSEDYNTRQLQLQTGIQPYAAKIGDTYNSLEFAQPAATPLMLGADLQQNGLANGVGSILNTALGSVMGNSFMSGISDLAQDMVQRNGDVNWLATLQNGAEQFATQSLPFSSLANQINKTIDNTKRDTYSKNELVNFGNKAMSKYPILSQQLPQKIDSVGNGMEWNEGMSLPMQIFNNFINPSTMSKYNPSDVERNALDMYYETGDTSQIPNIPTNSFGYGGYSEYKPTAEEQRQYSYMLADYLKKAPATVEGYSEAKIKAYNDWKDKVVQKNNLPKKKKK